MPSSVHKLLVHGVDIIKNFDLPVGQLAEDALEARHKEIRRHRLHHTRKSSRSNTNKDLMTALLLTSDPYISSLRKVTSRKSDLTGIEDYVVPISSQTDRDSIYPENLSSTLMSLNYDEDKSSG